MDGFNTTITRQNSLVAANQAELKTLSAGLMAAKQSLAAAVEEATRYKTAVSVCNVPNVALRSFWMHAFSTVPVPQTELQLCSVNHLSLCMCYMYVPLSLHIVQQ